MSRAYYNENDPYAAQWLRNLIAGGHIADGDVDDRSILDVRPKDLFDYTQCHFFAGIGGWSYALRLAGWPDARSVWTGSAPCQPFSVAGQQRRFADERHLWPAFFYLIEERRPPVVFGEQVAGKAGREWLDLVFSDLEGIRYAVGAVDTPAGGVGAPHIRQRLYWGAHALPAGRPERGTGAGDGPVARSGGAGIVADADGGHSGAERLQRGGQHGKQQKDGGTYSGMGNANHTRLEGRGDDAGQYAGQLAARAASPWDDIEWLACSDGKARPTQPGIFPLAAGVSNRVGRLRAYGNAIVPQVAAAFVRSYLECIP